MATTITNRANLRYTYGAVTETVASNLASTVLNDPLTATKSSLETAYRNGEDLTYVITMTNGSDVTLTDVTIVDDLGTYTASGVSVTPLTYKGPAQLFFDGVFSSVLEPVVLENSAAFTIPQLQPGRTATILYKATPNEYAPMTPDAEITNTAAFSPAASVQPVTATHTIPVDQYASVSIDKEMTPNPITDGAALVNTFTITNTGNVEATDLVLTDTFMTPLENVTVTIDGTPVPAGSFTYEQNLLTLPVGTQTPLSVPAATFTQDPTTGVVSIVPGVTTVVVTGNI